jgi:hypothetical protein
LPRIFLKVNSIYIIKCVVITAKSNNKVKTIWNIIRKETGKVHSTELVPSLLENDEKLKAPKNVANNFNKFFLTIAEKLTCSK